MLFKDIWKQLCNKKPLLENENSTTEFTSGNLKHLLEQVYDKGFDNGMKCGKALSGESKSDPFKDMFGGMFGS